MICSPLYSLVAYVWDIVGLMLCLGVYTRLWNGLLCMLSLVVIISSVGRLDANYSL